MYSLVNTYRFTPVENPEQFGHHCFRVARRLNLTGSLIIAGEGFNFSLNGAEKNLATFFYDSELFHCFLSVDSRLRGGGSHDLPAYQKVEKIQAAAIKKHATKESVWQQCRAHPHFHFFTGLPQRAMKRLRLRVKDEIIRSDFLQKLNCSFSLIADDDASHLSPKQFHQKMMHDKDAIVIDMRNDYEVAIGTLRNARHFHLGRFSDLVDKVSEVETLKDHTLLTFCTGGVRCEKSKILFESLGFAQVYQLDGGIFRYLREFPQGCWQGDCFVFDDRVSLDAKLQAGNFSRCHDCGQALNPHTGQCSYHACVTN